MQKSPAEAELNKFATNAGLAMDERAEVAVDGCAREVALFHLENEDRHVVFHAESDCCGVHDLEAAGDDFLVGDLVETICRRVRDRVCGVDAVDLGGLHNHIAFAVDSTESGTAVRGKERVARTSREDNHRASGEELESLATIEEFTNRFHADSGHHYRIYTLLVESVLHGEAVHHGAEHAHGVALSAIHAASRSGNAANKIAAANHECDLNTLLDDRSNFGCHVRKNLVVDAVALFTCEGFATELEKNALEFRHNYLPVISWCAKARLSSKQFKNI